jgi:hypothetical protein
MSILASARGILVFFWWPDLQPIGETRATCTNKGDVAYRCGLTWGSDQLDFRPRKHEPHLVLNSSRSCGYGAFAAVLATHCLHDGWISEFVDGILQHSGLQHSIEMKKDLVGSVDG